MNQQPINRRAMPVFTMAKYTTTADVVLTVNGRQAQKMLTRLQSDAKRLTNDINKAAMAGDKVTLKKLQRELRSTEKLIEQLQGSATTTERTLARMDRATPKELQRALRTLQQQLNGIERGSAAWNAHTQKIRALKMEIAAVNRQMTVQKSLWERMNIALNNIQTFLFGAAAALTGLVMAARRAVNSYADMEEAMANTRKYTRMTEEDVLRLNDAFLKMDTRIARDQLNALAQEGGRLGYNTVEKVKEYVEAASIIKVALVDLGEGATQTIAKISNIFGIEQMYGVRDAMLKVGSAVNHLSQNCTASKPYLVEFAQRMAGIGSTARMTVPEILALGATLDAHGQKVEMSSSAITRLVMKLFQSPAEAAQKVGLDLKEFTKVLNTNVTQGMMMFLDKLQQLGKEDALAALSPLFKDLGMDGVRMAQVLANLASHLDFLKWQLGEANKAFREGTSASNEYAIFNNTVQAAIDKAKNRVHELAVELGERLYPLMRHIYTSSSAFLRVLNSTVDWFLKYKGVLLSVAAVIATYYAWVVAVKVAHTAWNAVVAAGTALQAAWRTAMLLGKVVAMAFTGGIKAATHAMRLFNTVVKANPFGLILSAVTALVLLIRQLTPQMDEFTRKVKEGVAAARSHSAELVKEQRELDILFGKLKGSEKGTKDYLDAKNSIISQYGRYLKGLIDERGEIIDLAAAYDRLAKAIRRSSQERGIDEAEKSINTEYYSALAKNLDRLQASLEAYGASTQEAAELTQRAAAAIAAGTEIPEETKRRIDELGANVPTKDLQGNELLPIQGRGVNSSAAWLWQNDAPRPAAVVNDMIEKLDIWQQGKGKIESMRDGVAPLRKVDEGALERAIQSLKYVIDSGKPGSAMVHERDDLFSFVEVSIDQAKKLMKEYEEELAYRAGTAADNRNVVGGNPDFNPDDFTPYESEKDRKKRETKEKKEFKDALNAAKGEWERSDAMNTSDYSAGLSSYREYLTKRQEILMQYFADREEVYRRFGLANEGDEDEDFLELLKKKTEAQLAWEQKGAKLSVEQYRSEQQAEEVQLQMEYNTRGSILYGNEEALQKGLFDIRMKYLIKMRDVYTADSEQHIEYERQIQTAEADEQLRRQKLYAQRIAEWRKRYEYMSAGDRMKMELALLDEAYAQMLLSTEEYAQTRADIMKKYAEGELPDSAKPPRDSSERDAEQMQRDLKQVQSLYEQGVLSKEEYEKAKDRIARSYEDKAIARARSMNSEQANQLLDLYEAWRNFFDRSGEDGKNWASGLSSVIGTTFSVINAGWQMLNEYYQASADLQMARAEKKYDREIELAEGNSYKTKKLEKQKEKELARIKNEASSKSYSMQIAQAVAQTATNALAAYGSVVGIPVIGPILAPIAAAMATAAGMLQVATIKKQKQAAEAQGYEKGGFTPNGNADEPAGIVHAGEWVASQKLTRNPRVRPLLEALDRAQQSNTVGSLRMEDVSRAITAPAALSLAQQQPIVVAQPAPSVTVERDREYAETMRRLAKRLDEPFVTVNTVTGDKGIQRAQSEYDRLIRNKTPKSKRS